MRRQVDRAIAALDPANIEAIAFDVAVAFVTPYAALRIPLPIYRQFHSHSSKVEAACELIRERFDERHSISSIAREVGMSTFHFARVFRQFVGESPNQYLLRRRLADAARRLHEGSTVTDAAFDSGLMNLSYFIRAFNRRFGSSPGDFKRSRRGR